jgi:60 kDa SS-A/Ro ribonucleoprotein
MKINIKPESTTKVVNYMGEPAYALQSKAKLVNLGTTLMFGEPKYYGDTTNKFLITAIEVGEKDPEFLLKFAQYLRIEMYLRTAPVVLLVETANLPSSKGSGLVRKYAPHIIQRADELTEAISAQLKLFGKPIPASIKRGINDSFKQFTEYDLAKYNRDNEVKLKDVIRLTRPTPQQLDPVLVEKLMKNELAVPYTWEVEISRRGNKPEVWDELILSKKMGYMATLRNLNNMIKSGATELDTALAYITNEKAVINSKQMPYRYLSAYEAVGRNSDSEIFEYDSGKVKRTRDAIETALELSIANNVPKIKGKTVIITDNSGSARGDPGGISKMSMHSVRTMADIGNLLGLIAWYVSDNTAFAVFGDRLTMCQPDRSKGILANFAKVNEAGAEVGQSTEQGVFTMLNKMINDNIFADRIIVFSDLQIGDGKNQEYGLHGDKSVSVPELVKQYRKNVNPNFMYYSVSFNGYGNNVVIGDKTVLIGGWSDKLFKFINTVEQDANAQVKYIENNFGLQPKETQFFEDE